MTLVAQYGIGLGMGMWTFLMMLLMNTLVNRWAFFGALIAWIASAVVTVRVLKKKEVQTDVLVLSLSLILALTGLLTVIESGFIRWLLILLGTAMMGTLYTWHLRSLHGEWYQGKPFRRFVVSVWVFAAFGLTTFLFALLAFFPIGGVSMLLLFLIGLIYAGASLMIWQRYYMVGISPLLMWCAVVAIVMTQLSWTLQLLPLGYGALGMLLTWMWYILQLFARFHFSERGILWNRQLIFLGGNAILMAIVLLFYVRWV